MENTWNKIKIPKYYDTPTKVVVNEKRRAYEKAYREANKEKIKAYRDSRKDINSEASRRYREKYSSIPKPSKAGVYRDAKKKPCTDCGATFPYFVMNLDHVRGKKKFVVAYWQRSEITLDMLIKEIAKCEVVCVNCHHLRVARRRPPAKPLKSAAEIRRKAYINELKNQPCTDCKKTFDPLCMEFDHVRGKKAFIISQSYHYKDEDMMEELAKCELVCANCHRFRTHFTNRKKS
jgi:hypothetical protein